VPLRDIGLYRAEFSHPEIDFPRPDPSVVVSNIFGERQFCAGKHADRDGRIAF
jgi:hypothetical protein